VRKRLAKASVERIRDGSRKGLAGSELKVRVRDGYRDLARRFGFPLLCAERATPQQMTQRVISLLERGSFEQTELDERPLWEVEPEQSFEDALSQLPPSLQLYFSRRLEVGRSERAALYEAMQRAVVWAADPGDPILDRIRGLDDTLALARLATVPLRPDGPRRRLANRYPVAVARSLKGLVDEQADALRTELASEAPGAVLESLAGRNDAFALTLRERCWSHADAHERAGALVGLADKAAWRLRQQVLAEDPAVTIANMFGLQGAQCDEILETFAPHAPKAVLRAIQGRSDALAHRMRGELIETGREVIDSIRGLADPQSFALREQCLQRWPSSVAWSLLGLADDSRTAPMLQRCREVAPGDLFLKRRLHILENVRFLGVPTHATGDEFDG
ncbi:MAG: hypothetical protein JKY37_19590, partial [Nannocystaceae bacterium]|nr:hypothetical protein [Nannocystaceae bacterium]